MPLYRYDNLRLPHDIHYSWSGWPSASKFPPTLPEAVLSELTEGLAKDQLTLESNTWSPDHIQVTVSAGPSAAPVWVAQRIKGRLDHAFRKHRFVVAFSRKVGLRAVGHNRTDVAERYVRDQLEHVDLADPLYRKTLAEVAVHDPSVDLSMPAESSHGRYWYNLHLVFVVAGRYRMGSKSLLNGIREQVLATCEAHQCALKRSSIMPDHMHLALRGNPKLSPAEIAAVIQEATSEVAGCRLWEYEFYAGTFGEYDHNAVPGVKGGVRRLR